MTPEPADILPDPPDLPDDIHTTAALTQHPGRTLSSVRSEHAPENLNIPDLALRESLLDTLNAVNAHVPGTTVVDTRLRNCDLSGIRADDAALRRVHLIDCKATGAIATRARLADVRITRCKLNLATLWNIDCRTVRFEDCDLREADFTDADLRTAVFRNCDLRNARLSGARLGGADLRTSHIDGLIADPAHLRGLIVDPLQAAAIAQLTGADIREPPESPNTPPDA